jgi:hypothetical protein
MKRRTLLLCAAFALLLLGLFAQNAPADNPPPAITTLGTGFDYSRGDYGLAADTEVLSVPLTLSHERGPWIFEARAPWIRIEGPATVVAGGGSPTRPTASAQSGPGDITLATTYRFGLVADTVNLAATVRAKLPTGSEERGLGTGETDLYGQVDLYRTFGSVTPFASFGYAALGASTLYPLEDGPYATAGAHFRTSERTVVTAAYSHRHRFIAGGDHGADAMLAITHDVNPRWRVMAYALKGFTNASPDHGGGLHISRRF